MGELLRCSGIFVEENGQVLLKDASICLEQGEIHALIGDNGAGKSMLMKCIAGMVPYKRGEIWLEGERQKPYTLTEARKRGIYMLSHRSSLLPNLSVAENMYLTRWLKKSGSRIDWRRQRREAIETFRALEKFGISIDVDALVGKLGMAQQKIIEIMKMISIQAKILIFDESFSELTPTEVDIVLDILAGLKEQGHSFFWVTQQHDKILRYADRLSLMQDGSIIMTESREALASVLQNMEQVRPAKYTRVRKPSKEVLFEARAVCDPYILSDVSFSVRKGEVLGITGMMGSGRSCLAKLISGINRMSKGEIFFDGEKLEPKKEWRRLRKEVIYFPEDVDRSVVFDLAISKNVTLSNLHAVTSSGVIDLKLERRLSKDYGKRLGFTHPGFDRAVKELSLGNMQKVVLARSLLSRARLLVLDEPMKSLDSATRLEAYNIINAIAKNGQSVVLLSSDYYEMVTLCDRVLVLRGGTIAKELVGDEISTSNIIKYSCDSWMGDGKT